MKIEIDVSVSDFVFFLLNNEIRKGRVAKIDTETNHKTTNICYSICDERYYGTFMEDNIFVGVSKAFKTKEELLASL